MRCTGCRKSSDGFAVLPGIGETGEIRFYCDPCARRDRVKMRYWDGRDLDVGGWRENPDLGEHYPTLIFSFQDLGRMRRTDLSELLAWIEDEDLSAALRGSDSPFQVRILEGLPDPRRESVRKRIPEPRSDDEVRLARLRIVETVRKL